MEREKCAHAHFESDEKPKREPLEIEIFLLSGANERVGGGQEPSKTLLRIFNQQ